MSLTPEGFDRPRLDEIKTDYDQRFTDALGPVNTEADSVVGQIIGIFSAALDDAYEALEDTYDAMYPATAEGTSLDGAVSFVGMTRLGAAPTTVVAMAYGTESTLLPAGVFARALDNRQYITTTDTVISRSSAGDVIITVITLLNNGNYQIIVNGVSVTYTADADPTALEIVTGLRALFDPDVILATLVGETLRLRAANMFDDFTLTVDSKLSISTLSTPVTFTAVELGAFALPVNALTRIDSPILGWDSVNNLVAGATGRFVESDEELRARHLSGVRATGSATLQAIRARLLAEVDSLTYVAIYENRTNSIDADGLPGHSFETVIAGGLDQAIGNKLFEVKPAGIETFGTTAIQVIDDNGDAQIARFSRATTSFAWVRVSVNALNPEEPLTLEVIQAITTAVLNFGNTIGIGDDIINQRFYGPIYSATTGIGSITVEIAVTATIVDIPAYTTANIPIGRTSHAIFSASRITVLGV
jgi:uncharacterized phage protein gp47/JayE